jgi:hypothetical protein
MITKLNSSSTLSFRILILTLLLLSTWLVGARVLAGGSAGSPDANARTEITQPYDSTSEAETAEPVPMATPPPSEEHNSNGDDVLVSPDR